MKDYIEKRALALDHYIIENNYKNSTNPINILIYFSTHYTHQNA